MTAVSGLLCRRILREHIATKLNPVRSDVAENNVFVNKDAVGDEEIFVQVHISIVAQWSGAFDDFTIDLFSDDSRILCRFSPLRKLTQLGELIRFTIFSDN